MGFAPNYAEVHRVAGDAILPAECRAAWALSSLRAGVNLRYSKTMRQPAAVASFVLLVALSCTKKNPEFCGADGDCDEGVCNLDLNRCEGAADAAVNTVDAAVNTVDAAVNTSDAAPNSDAAFGFDAATVATLGVSVSGNGTVTSTPPGINCGALCEAAFPTGSSAVLNGLPAGDHTLLEWTGGCVGFQSCELTVSGSVEVAARFVPTGVSSWARTFGGGDLDVGTAVAFGPDGSLYLTGLFAGTVSFGGDPLSSNGLSQDVFVAKFTRDGGHVWSRRFGGPDDDMPTAMSVDSSGNVVFLAQLGYAGFDGFDAKPSPEALLARLRTSDGEPLWQKTLTASEGYVTAQAVATDALGNVATGGGFSGTLDVQGDTLTSSGGTLDAFAVWYSPTGEFLRAGRYGGSGAEFISDLVFDRDSSTYVVGTFEDEIHLGFAGATGSGGSDAFVGKFGASGLNIFTIGIGGASSDLGIAIDVDRERNLFIAGRFSGEIDFGGGAVTSDGGGMFVASYEHTGAFRWAANYGRSASGFPDLPSDIAVSERGRVALTGTVAGNVDFGGGELPGAFMSGFVLWMDASDGDYVWSRTYLPTGGAGGMTYGVAYDSVGVLATTGMFDGTLELDGAGILGAGDAYLEVYWP